MYTFFPEVSSKCPRSQSDVGIFAKLKSVCLSTSGSSKSQVQAPPGTGAGPNLSISSTDLSKEDKLDEFLCSDLPASKSCSDISYSFKDESDIDIVSLLDMKFGKIGDFGKGGNNKS